MTKKASILNVLRERSLNRFEAQRYGDHCLNTTISILAAEGHKIHSEWETVPTRFGRSVRVKRYFLLEANDGSTNEKPRQALQR